mgnify:FL=1
MRVKDISIGDLVKITTKSRVRPLPVDSIDGITVIRWTTNKTIKEDLKGELLFYLGPFNAGPRYQYRFHQFACNGKKYYIRSHNFRYLEKI